MSSFAIREKSQRREPSFAFPSLALVFASFRLIPDLSFLLLVLSWLKVFRLNLHALSFFSLPIASYPDSKLYFISSIISTLRGYYPHVFLLIFHPHTGSRVLPTRASSSTSTRSYTIAPRSLFSVSSWSSERWHYFASWPPLFRSILLNCGRDNTSCAPLRPTRRFETNPHSRFPIISQFYPNTSTNLLIYLQDQLHPSRRNDNSAFEFARIDIYILRSKSHMTRNAVTGHESLIELFSLC